MPNKQTVARIVSYFRSNARLILVSGLVISFAILAVAFESSKNTNVSLIDKEQERSQVRKDNEIKSPQNSVITYSNHAQIDIPDIGNASPYPSTITLNTSHLSVKKVTVTLRALLNGSADDLDIYLVGPNGQGTMLMSDAGGTGFNDQTFFVFDQTAPDVIADNGPLPGGTGMTVTSRPVNYESFNADVFDPPGPGAGTNFAANLDVFNGINPNGDWKLLVVDDTPGSSGYFANGWDLNFIFDDVVVNAADDVIDMEGCTDAHCSLREAIIDADPGATIRFSPLFSTPQTIYLRQPQVLPLQLAELRIDKNLTIDGPGANLLTVVGATATDNFLASARIFNIIGNQYVVTINGMTITGGYITTLAEPEYGGAILNNGILTLNRCIVTGNYAITGGAIWSLVKLELNETTISNNIALGNSAKTAGAIYTVGGVDIKNSTISGNRTYLKAPNSAGAIYTENQSIFAPRIVNTTITNNFAAGTGSAGGIFAEAPVFFPFELQNNIIAGNNFGTSIPDVIGSFDSTGYNLIGNPGSSMFTGPFDQTGTAQSPLDPHIAPLSSYGGTTPTHALLGNSSALDKGLTSLTFDQRGSTRPVDVPGIANANNGEDIGSFEAGNNLIVNKTADTSDGSCTAADCSLREAIAAANSGDIIYFSTLFNTPKTITLGLGELVINKNLTVLGSGADLLTISGNNSSRVFTTSSTGVFTVVLQGMTISDGFPFRSFGGAISNNGNLTVSQCHVTSSIATLGGGIFNGNNGTLTIFQSTISNNTALNSDTGGGIDSRGSLNVLSSTISGNSATSGNNNAGGIRFAAASGSSTALIDNSTITNNTTAGSGSASGLRRTSGVITLLKGTIVAGNVNNSTFPDVVESGSPNIAANRYCLIGNPGTISFNPTTKVGTALNPLDPLLLALANYGGTTPTHAIASAMSPALNTSRTWDDREPQTDQRGFIRAFDFTNQVNNGPDIGAFESQGGFFPSISISDVSLNEGNSGFTNFTFNVTLSAADTAPISVHYAAVDGTALGGFDYVVVPDTTLDFAPGETSKQVTVLVGGDTDNEPNETFFINLTNATNAIIADGQGLGTIINDDTDMIAPTGSGSAPNVTSAGGSVHTATVTYTDNIAINASTVGLGDIRITGPNAFDIPTDFAGVSPSGNGSPRTATYPFPAPGGSWDATDNGIYNIAMQANQVADTAGNFVTAGTIGSFTVSIATPTATNTPTNIPTNTPTPGPCDQTFDTVPAPALPASWSSTATGGETAWVTSTTSPNTSPNDVFAPDVATVGETGLVSSTIAVPAGGLQITFANLFNLEFSNATVGFDGMVLEISTDAGATFSDIITAGGSFVTGGYTHLISPSFGNPLANRMAWSGLSGGTTAAPTYITTTVNLPAAANGHNALLRWRVGTDSSAVAAGVAGVRIDTITGLPCPPATPTSTSTNTPTNTATSTATSTTTSTPTAAPTVALLTGTNTSYNVKAFAGAGGSESLSFGAYSGAFAGGVRVAAGDVNLDAHEDIIVGNGPGAATQIKVFNGVNNSLLFNFFALDPAFTGGVFVASGDINGDLRPDIITGADAGSTSRVRVFSGQNATVLRDFVAFSAGFTGGVRVASGDINGDGRADIITSAGPGGGPQVRVFSGLDGSVLADFFAYNAGFTGGVFVASGDVNGDGRADIVTGADAGGGPEVRVFSGVNLSTLLYDFFAFTPSFTGGVRVAAGDVNGDGKVDIITGPGSGAAPEVKVFSGLDNSVLRDFFAYNSLYTGGVFVGGVRGLTSTTTSTPTPSPTAPPTPVTFPGTGVGAIPDGGATCPTAGAPLDIQFNVTGVDLPPTSVGVSITFGSPNHTWMGDVTATLIAPNATQQSLFGRTGATTAASAGDDSDLGSTYFFSDAAAAPPSGGWWQESTTRLASEVMSAGTYRATDSGGAGATNPMPPTSLNTTFNSIPTSNGTWILRLIDSCSADTGAVIAASLTLAAPQNSISGTITYGNAPQGAATRFISNAQLNSTVGSPSVTTTTAAPGVAAGTYTLTGFGSGNYTVTPSKTGGVNGAINSFDAGLIALHVAGPPNAQINANQLLVADVSGNNIVSSFDAGMIAKYVAGPPFTAPGIGSTATWKFTPTSRSYPSVAMFTGEDYIGLLMGEVSGNWTNTGARPSSKIATGNGPERAASIALPSLTGGVGKEITIPVNVNGVANRGVIAYQFDLKYDPSVMLPLADAIEMDGTASRGLSVVTNAHEPGLLRVVVYGPIEIVDDGVLLYLKFTAVGVAGAVSPLSLDDVMFNEGKPRVTTIDGRIELY